MKHNERKIKNRPETYTRRSDLANRARQSESRRRTSGSGYKQFSVERQWYFRFTDEED